MEEVVAHYASPDLEKPEKNRKNIQYEKMKNRKTPLECCQTLPIVSFVEKKRGSCKKAGQRERKVFSAADFSLGSPKNRKAMLP